MVLRSRLFCSISLAKDYVSNAKRCGFSNMSKVCGDRKSAVIKMEKIINTVAGQSPKIYLYKRIVQAKLFIDSHYAQKIDLGNISEEAYFSKFHFIRLFKSIYGKTPHQYLIQVRVENAKRFLRLGYSVSEACFQVGFESLTSFTGLFKKCGGNTPSEYQRQYKMREELIRAKPLSFIPNCFAEQKGWAKK